MAYDLIVIGGGPAGYVAAIRAAQLGKNVACVEADRAGGTCLNWGCIPTKALLKNAELYHTLRHKAAEFGLKIDGLSYDWSAVVGRSRKVSGRLAGGIEFLLKKNKVDYVNGLGAISRCLTNTKITAAADLGDHVEITVEGPKENGVIRADICLVAIGIQPVLPSGMQPALTERGYIQIGARYETSLPGVYAAGDITGPPWLAHTASFEAVQAVEGLYLHGHTPRKVKNFPGCTYCHPQVASVGKTERELKAAGIAYKVGKIPFIAIGKAIASGESEGFAKLLFGKVHGELLGAHLIGENATELIAEMGLALDQELTAEEIHATIHAHPTMSEVIHEAALAAEGHAIHV